MQTMPISQFKATCLAVLERVQKTGQPLRVTRFGKPIADIIPAQLEATTGNWLGQLRGTAKIAGDITVPSSELTTWDALT